MTGLLRTTGRRALCRAVVIWLATAAPAGAQTPSSETADSAEPNPLLAQLAALEQQNQQLRQEVSRLRKVVTTAQALDRRNQTLETRMVELEREMQLARQEAQTLRDRTGQDWFLRGAGVLLVGLLLGVLLSRLQRPKAPRWSDL